MNSSIIKNIYTYPIPTFVENIHLLLTGSLLLTTFSSGSLLILDSSSVSPLPKPLITLPNATGLTGIARVGEDTYAVSGGNHTHFAFEIDSMFVYIVRIGADEVGELVDMIPVPVVRMMNGMASLPSSPHIILSADSLAGTIIRVDTRTRSIATLISDPALGPGNSSVPLGINGLKIRDGYCYFTNSALGTFSRYAIDEETGEKRGEIVVIARLEGQVGMGNAYDDFDVDGEGNAWLAVHDRSVQKVSVDGTTTMVRGGEGVVFRAPTAVVMAGDGKSFFLSTGGGVVNGVEYGGQVWSVECW
ncbi:Calcium-dependent phosphotriesterase [Glarea lozoyensis ATCC 20868]|uniref:Calcium-dependent phosphotriesterase n=1 Tax=Glarea lozoyensis (strain ATCC 20868 / MF5171) TaxID=1116229 RepID=S3EC00_GLAL2|nr:Calcium-dependent phosphotriesterase [Glarea lozoyensis ATCC 20868]EPE35808.1 Calcium-dependent phosphotriesterase [Glarea lozoyensis ATCC 20868]